MTVKKTVMGNKVTASADSTGLENNQAMIIKHHHSVKKAQTTSVTRRNARERNRVKGVNDGFGILKKHLSHIGMKNKSSKVETLRGAIEYIKAMRDMLGHPEISEDSKADIKLDFGNNDGKFVSNYIQIWVMLAIDYVAYVPSHRLNAYFHIPKSIYRGTLGPKLFYSALELLLMQKIKCWWCQRLF